MRIRLSQLRQIIKEEVSRALHEDLPADIFDGASTAPSNEQQEAAKALILDKMQEMTKEERKKLNTLLGIEEEIPNNPNESKEYYYNNILKNALHEDGGSAVRAGAGIIGGALGAALALFFKLDPAMTAALTGITGASASAFAGEVADLLEVPMDTLSAAADNLPKPKKM